MNYVVGTTKAGPEQFRTNQDGETSETDKETSLILLIAPGDFLFV